MWAKWEKRLYDMSGCTHDRPASGVSSLSVYMLPIYYRLRREAISCIKGLIRLGLQYRFLEFIGFRI